MTKSLSKKYSDAEAKAILLKKWPECPAYFWQAPVGKTWLRALPTNRTTTAPCIKTPGTRDFKTQPDGLYICVHDASFVDVVIIEVCGSPQNLNDKRSRYAPNLSSLILSVPHKWLAQEAKVTGRGKKLRWEVCDGYHECPDEAIELPIRNVRVLYFLPKDIFDKWKLSHNPMGHEFFCRQSSLTTVTHQDMREFLSSMSINRHFHTRRV